MSIPAFQYLLSFPLMTKRLFQVLLLGIALAAVAMVVVATKHGVGLSNDSTGYIAGARQLAHGKGLVMPNGSVITHFPPLFAGLLALPGAVGIDAMIVARVLNLLLLGAIVMLAAAIVSACSGGSRAAGLLAAGLMATSVDLLTVHAYAWSEPLFILNAVAGLWLLQRYLWSPRRWLLVSGSVLTAAAFLTRYAGAAAVLTGAAGLLFVPGRPLRRRMSDIFVLLAITLIPMLVWFTRNYLAADSATNRRAVYHPITLDQLTIGARTFTNWFIDVRSPVVAATFSSLFTVGLIVLIAISFTRTRVQIMQPASPARMPLLFGLFVPIYASFLVISLCWFDAQIPLDQRMLTPMLVMSICFLMPGVGTLAAKGRSAKMLWITFTSLMILMGWFLYRDYRWINQSRRWGLGYASPSWRRSPVMAAVRALPHDVFIYTNAPGAVLMLADHAVADLPQKFDRNTKVSKDDYRARMNLMRQRMSVYRGYIVYFSAAGSRHNLPTLTELKLEMPLEEEMHCSDAAIYRWGGPVTQP